MISAKNAFAELKLWRVPSPVRGSTHGFKYSLAYIVGGRCVLRFDNEAGKGDHKHSGTIETAYQFRDLERLLADFWIEIDHWRPE